MELGETIPVFKEWFYLHFTENNGMAFGLEFGGKTGKILLSLVRITAVIAIGWYITRLYRERAHPGLIISISLVFAGAIGNIIDSVFYGVVFSSSSTREVASLFPEIGGYSNYLQGRVVDMFYLPLFDARIPSWFPLKAEENFTFFSPVFNFADAAISAGVIMLLFMQKKFVDSLN